jgi:hypothetical protein
VVLSLPYPNLRIKCLVVVVVIVTLSLVKSAYVFSSDLSTTTCLGQASIINSIWHWKILCGTVKAEVGWEAPALLP